MSIWPRDRIGSALAAGALFLAIAALLLGVLIGIATSAMAQSKSRPLKHPPFSTASKPIYMRCAAPRAIDGDTIACASGYRIRLLGIQAPEKRCRAGLECIAGDAAAAQASLTLALQQGPLTFQYIRRDKYGRPVVIARAGEINLSCWMLATTATVYKPAWDHRRMIGQECQASATTGRRTP